MEGKECPIASYTDAVNRMVAYKASTISYVLNAFSGFYLPDNIENTVKLFAGQFVNDLGKAL
jgi:hypothetical protein